MSTIEQYRPLANFLAARTDRSVSRSLTELRSAALLQRVQTEAKAQQYELAAEAITAVAGKAMQHAALISQAEQQLAQMVPHASGRLAAIADAHGFALQALVADAARTLGRQT